MVLCVGEILADMIGSEKDGQFVYERKAGGAPFNVACGIANLGAKASFAGSVGNDLIGEFLIGFAKKRGLKNLYINKRTEENTTLAFVQLDNCGERSFCFYRKNTADYKLPRLSDQILQKADIVHIGSLMLSENEGYKYALRLAKRAKALKKIVSFDVNFRSDIFKDENAAKERYKKLLEIADVIKFSEEEIDIFGEEYIKEKLFDKLLCISLGGNGSEWRLNGKSGRVNSIKVNPVDTTGAGDAFFAGVLSGLDGTDKSRWTEEFLNEVFLKANVCGALTTLKKGAIDGLPDVSQVEDALKELKSN